MKIDTHVLKTILFIVSENEWSTKERKALFDMQIAFEEGKKIYLCAREDSPIYKKSKELIVELIPMKDHFFKKIFFYHRHFNLQIPIKRIQFDLIVAYDFSFLVSICIQLRTNQNTALIFSQCNFVPHYLKKIWFRPFFNRIDVILLINKNLKQDARGSLDVQTRKIETILPGVLQKNLESEIKELTQIDFEIYKDYFLVGTYIGPTSLNMDNLTSLISALKVISDNTFLNKKNKLVFISEVEFSSFSEWPVLMDLIKSHDLIEDVLFVTTGRILNLLSSLSLWISHNPNELIEDFAISALINEIPIILPRNFCSKDLLEEYLGVGETYKLFDARELRDKWIKIILGYGIYKEKIRLYKYFIERDFSYKNYKFNVLSAFIRPVTRKIRAIKSN